MPRIISFIAAEGVAIDQLTSRATAFNTIDHFLLPKLPARIVRLSVMSIYELGDSTETFLERIELVSPDDSVIARSETPITLFMREPGQIPNVHRSLHILWSPQLDVVGDHRLNLKVCQPGQQEWTTISSLCITVLVQLHPILNSQTPSVSVPPISSAPPGSP